MAEQPQEKPASYTAPSRPSGTQVRRCTCADAYQDERYGAGRRVFNACTKGWRCTVCRREDQA
jgi:hypothetical protein